MRRPIALSLVVLATLGWTATLIAAPTWAAMPGFAGPTASALTYAAGSFVCHQQPERSFHRGAAQLPVCARCLGLYAGASIGVLGWVVASGRRRRHSIARTRVVSMRPAVLIAAAPTLVTVTTAWLGLWDPANDVRFALAVPLGAVTGVLVAALAAGDLE
jgi:uncharacterized membrane protein